MNNTRVKQQRQDLARVAATAHLLGQLCELSPNAEPICLEHLEQVFKDIAKVCDSAQTELANIIASQQ